MQNAVRIGSRQLEMSQHRSFFLALSTLIVGALLIIPFGDVAPRLDYYATVRALRTLPASAVALSISATVLSFAAFVGRDATALKFIGAKTSPLALLLAGFCGSALGNAAGLGALTAAAVRYRIYGALGIAHEEIARLLTFVLGGFILGLSSVGAMATLIEAEPLAAMFGASATMLRIISSGVLATVGCLLIFGLRSEIRVAGFPFSPPSRPSAFLQLGLTTIRLFGAAVALWVLLPPMSVSFLAFAAIFAAATAFGAISHLPGGAGVFELVVLWAFRDAAQSDAIAAGLIAYRGVYFALPLILSSALFAVFELAVAARSRATQEDDRVARAVKQLSPTFIGVLTFGAGVMLLASGATPMFNHRLELLSLHVPLWLIETSSFLGSLVGVVMLFLACGLIERRDGAWRLALALATVSVGFSFFKGLAYVEIGLLSVLILLLMATRPQFHRPTSMLDQPFTSGWFVAVGIILLAAFGLLWLAFDGVDLRAGDLWWEFAFDAQAPRALRALVGASAGAVCFGVSELIRAPKGFAPAPSSTDLTAALEILRSQPHGEAMLALMRDKSLLFSASRRSFLMYGKRGRSWVALFDPVGPDAERRELVRRFVDLAHEHGGRAAFYQVRAESLPLYLDAGLSVRKLGEEARISLNTFNLGGGAASHLRYALKRGSRDGLTFEEIEPEDVNAALPMLQTISDAWLDMRSGEEKGFSVAAFDPIFLGAQRIGLVRSQGEPIAFVSIMETRARDEAAVALMRHRTRVSPYAMEYLFVKTILAVKAQGFQTLSLGVAPLAGVRPEPLSSGWHWIGAQIWKHGDRFYNFQGLRTFKSKFNPTWAPRYLAASGTVGPFVALADTAAMIAKAPRANSAT
jgi:phosphatidylglycerol lysyltransferase